MTERKFTDEKIIKALELCIQNTFCECCEYRERTDKSDICPIRMDALNLINKQNAEIEQLKRNLEQCENGYTQELHLARCQLADAKSEVEQLVQGCTRLVQEKDALIKNYAECMKDYASEIFAEIERIILDNTYPDFNREHKPINIWKAKTGYDAFYKLKKKYTEGGE